MATKLVAQRIVEYGSGDIWYPSLHSSRAEAINAGGYPEFYREREITPVIEFLDYVGHWIDSAYQWNDGDRVVNGVLESDDGVPADPTGYRYRPGTEPVEILLDANEQPTGILSSLPGVRVEESDFVTSYVDENWDDDDFVDEPCECYVDGYNDSRYDHVMDSISDETDFSGISVAVTSENEIVVSVFDRDEIALDVEEAEELFDKLSRALVGYRAMTEYVPF